MKLLGSYPNQISSFQYQELLKLLQDSLVSGDYGGGRLFDAEASRKLKAQAEDFTSLSFPSAGDRTQADSLNYPLSIVQARYNALSKERKAFLQRLEAFLAVLEKDASLIKQLLGAEQLKTWLEWIPRHGTADWFSQDFVASTGEVSGTISAVDPALGSASPLFDDSVQEASFLLPNGSQVSGLTAPANIRQIVPTQMSWFWTSTGTPEEVYGKDWTRLSVLQDKPNLTFGSPQVTMVSPETRSITGVFEISGSSILGNVSVLVRTLEVPVRRQRTYSATGPFYLSPYRASREDLIVTVGTASYESNLDYDLDTDKESRGLFTPKSSLIGQQVVVSFTEFVPAYQCSLNGLDWSPTVVFDKEHPWGDSLQAIPLNIQGDAFPLIDEKANDLGLKIRLLSAPPEAYLFRVTTPVASSKGLEAWLRVEFDRPAYINSLTFEPLSVFPMKLIRVLGENFTSGSGEVLFSGEAVIEDATTIRFSRQLVKDVVLVFRQENYTFKEHLIPPEDRLRKEALLRVQSLIPKTVLPRVNNIEMIRKMGVQYQLGLRGIYGEDWQPYPFGKDSIRPSVVSIGPYEVAGMPEVVVFDAQYTGEVDFYVYTIPFDQSGNAITGFFKKAEPGYGFSVLDLPEMDPGPFDASYPDKPIGGAVRGQVYDHILINNAHISKARLFVKAVIRTADSVIQRFSLQVSHV